MTISVAVLGCGPAGLAAAYAAEVCGADVSIWSRPGRDGRIAKSELHGAQSLKSPIPGLFEPRSALAQGVMFNYLMAGTVEGYLARLYGRARAARDAPTLAREGILTRAHRAWDVRAAYDLLWQRYGAGVRPLTLASPTGLRSGSAGGSAAVRSSAGLPGATPARVSLDGGGCPPRSMAKTPGGVRGLGSAGNGPLRDDETGLRSIAGVGGEDGSKEDESRAFERAGGVGGPARAGGHGGGCPLDSGVSTAGSVGAGGLAGSARLRDDETGLQWPDGVREADLVVSSVPANLICGAAEGRETSCTWETGAIWAAGAAPTLGRHIDLRRLGVVVPPNTVVYNGEPDVAGTPRWSRISVLYGYTTVEWPVIPGGGMFSNAVTLGSAIPPWGMFSNAVTKPVVSQDNDLVSQRNSLIEREATRAGAVRVQKPLFNTCGCRPGWLKVGRYGRWEKDELVHHAYWRTLDAVHSIVMRNQWEDRSLDVIERFAV